MTPRELIQQALDYERDAWDNDEEVNGGDLVDWFAQWRQRAAQAIAPNRGEAYCLDCGSDDLEFAMWVSTRTGEQTSECGSSGGYVFCNNCGDEVRTTIDRREAAEARLAKRKEAAE